VEGVVGRRWGAAVLVATVAANLAFVAALAPVSAVLIVWPFLFLLPGWVLVGRFAPSISPPGRLGAGVVVSVVLSAHLIYAMSLVVGFGRFSTLAATALLALGTAVTARGGRVRARNGSRGDLVATVRRYAAPLLVANAVTLLVLAVLSVNGWRQTADGWVSGGWNWSDLLVHVAIGNSIVHGNFPPEVPYFAGVPLTYHWFADFHGAIAASVAGLDIIPVFFASSALFAGSLVLVTWELARRLTRSRRVATIAAIVLASGGGMGWLRLVGDLVAGGDLATLLTTTPYDNSWADGWPRFRIASVLGTGFFPHRASTIGLPALVTAILLLHATLRRQPAGVLLAGLVAALLAPFHFYAFPATYLVALLLVIAHREWQRPTFARDAVLFLAPVGLAIPYIAGAVLQQSERGAFRFVAGWSEAPREDGLIAVAFFYLTNLGLPFVLALAAALWVRTPGRGFLAAWLVALFMVPNVVVVSAVEFDMNKYFQMMWIAVAMLAGALMRRWPAPLVAAVLAVSAISPGLAALWHAVNPLVTMSNAQEAAARWIERNTPERAVFATDAFINSPVDLAGRLRISTFGPYVANLGYDPDPRARDLNAIYCDGPDVAAALLERYRATYVLSSGGIPNCADGTTTEFWSSERFETVYSAGGVSVWRLRE